MRKKLKVLLLFFVFVPFCYGKHVFKESYYQEKWCKAHNGIMEFKNKDNTRIDCLTKNYAVEFDFAPKWAESVGQALYYGLVTNKRPKVVLILENPEKDYKYYERVKFMSEKLNFEVECMTLKSVAENKK